MDEFNDAAQLANPSISEPILITTNGTILAGSGRWRSAVFAGRHEINCIEYSLSEEEALQFIISHHQPQRGWNAFIRIRLALKLELYFQKRARDNMSAGGKHKGLHSSGEMLVEHQDSIVRRQRAFPAIRRSLRKAAAYRTASDHLDRGTNRQVLVQRQKAAS